MHMYIYISMVIHESEQGAFSTISKDCIARYDTPPTAIPPRPHQEKEKTGSESKETSQADVSSRKWRESTACCGCSLQKRSLDNGNIMGKPSINGDLMGFTGIKGFNYFFLLKRVYIRSFMIFMNHCCNCSML